jgi:hypothetical protein
MGMMKAIPKTTFDFLSGALDPRITFARSAATATLVNASGYIEAVLADVPRFDYNPMSKSLRGILIEGDSTNVLPRSQEFDNNTVWEKSGTATVTANQIAAPDNTTTADLFRCGATGASEVRRNNISLAAGTHTFSVFARKEVSDFVVIQVQDTATASFRRVWFNINLNSTGSATSAGTNIALLGSRIEPYENGFYRVSITVSLTAGTISGRTNIYLSEGDGVFSGNALSGIYIWGAQLEAGAFATSYIPTTTTSLTRNADVATITGTAFSGIWRSGPGSILVRALPSTVSGTRPLVQVDDATADNIIALRGNTTNPELYIRAGGADQATIDAGTISAAAYRLAGAWQAGSAAASLNSGLAVNGAPASIPAATQMRLGSDGTNYLNGHLQAVEYWDEFLTPATLQSVTTSAGYRSIIGPVMRDAIIA